MRVFQYIAGMMIVGLSLTSCQKYFLEKPETTGNTTIETVFSNRAGAEGAIAAAYRQVLVQNLWNGRSLNNGILSGISGETSFGETWASLQRFVSAGFAPTPFENNRAQSTDNFFDNFQCIRQCYTILENIDKVGDIPGNEKEYIKAEMKGLIAFRYAGMMIRYGGVPIVTQTLKTDDNLNIPRATLQETLDFVVKMADEAAAGLPDNWDAKYYGRITKGVALAVKARALLYAARPLFNNATPYLPTGGNDALICFGSLDNDRWNTAIAAHEAVITWATQAGYHMINTGGDVNVPNPEAFDDYGTATSVPGNAEVLLGFKLDEGGNKFFKFYNSTRYSGNERYLTDNYGMLTNFLENYYRADGTDQQWPGQGAGNALPYADYRAKMEAMEPRFKASNYAHGIDTWNNPGEYMWSYAQCSSGQNHEGRGKGAAQSTKYYYMAGTRIWFEFPVFRMAEFYLSLAEAYNEAGNASKALANLNIVHNRAGLPSITETNKDLLRKTIQREWAVEYYNENKRYFDVRHWKLQGLDNGILGGPMREFQFTLVAQGANDRLPENLLNYYDKVAYSAYWHPKMYLEPIPQEEIDKRVLVQNPGY
ncbi:RagB/SusD family nutrient uptake outer membrane protein [Chitinophaga sp. GCM10012297]|uniref:RagB/SusD family nutrient uptake outer membrane protein n=1 Tax=Chitinophaga chungangae TaxID=2821488 RepID=A0ABS3YAQ0_9BACT|nr:RagB/SusD family nutrient uptake outer membrane protein [Chitinophaga chungangae]MBO9151761.1 RagB/SusD family nutrient uptake outer membrane protein [Chitinophaga chungangae]